MKTPCVCACGSRMFARFMAATDTYFEVWMCGLSGKSSVSPFALHLRCGGAGGERKQSVEGANSRRRGLESAASSLCSSIVHVCAEYATGVMCPVCAAVADASEWHRSCAFAWHTASLADAAGAYLSLPAAKCQGTTPVSGDTSCLGAVHVPPARLPEACPVRPDRLQGRPLVQAVLHHRVWAYLCPWAVVEPLAREALHPLPQCWALGSRRLLPRARPGIPATSLRLTSCTQKPSFHRL